MPSSAVRSVLVSLAMVWVTASSLRSSGEERLMEEGTSASLHGSRARSSRFRTLRYGLLILRAVASWLRPRSKQLMA